MLAFWIYSLPLRAANIGFALAIWIGSSLDLPLGDAILVLDMIKLAYLPAVLEIPIDVVPSYPG